MLQLIITLTSLALLAMAWAPLLPADAHSQRATADTALVATQGFARFARAYQALTEEADGYAPEVTADADGGLQVAFGERLRLLPFAPSGFVWSYGVQAGLGVPTEGMNYVCLYSPAAAEADWNAAGQVAGEHDETLLFVSTECGAAESLEGVPALPSPLALTLHLTYEPPPEEEALGAPETPVEGAGEPPPVES